MIEKKVLGTRNYIWIMLRPLQIHLWNKFISKKIRYEFCRKMRRNRKWITFDETLKKKKKKNRLGVLVFGLYDVCNGRQWDRGKWTLRLSRFHAMVAPDDYYSVGGGSFQLSRAEWRLNWHCLYDRLRCLLATVLYCRSRISENDHGKEIKFKIVESREFSPPFHPRYRIENKDN